MTVDKVQPEFEKIVKRSVIISDVKNSMKNKDD